MLFYSSLRKDLARSFGAILVVLITVVMTMTLIRTLGEASRGIFNPADVMIIMAYVVLSDMPTLLCMCLFMSILSVMTRMYRESEMVIWFGSGKGLASFAKPLLQFAWPIFIIIAALSFFILPWSHGRIEDLRDRFEKRGDLERVEPGRFQESAQGDRVFFIEKNNQNQHTANNVFIATQAQGVETVTSAATGTIEFVGNEKYLLLQNGQRMERSLSTDEITISHFEKYQVLIEGSAISARAYAPLQSLSSLDLIKNPQPAQLSELSWRLGLPVVALNLLILGLASANSNPRSGRTTQMVFSFLLFIVYFNLLVLGRSWINSGQVSFVSYFVQLHGGALLLACLWLMKSHFHWSLASAVRRSTRRFTSHARKGAA
jgi:lipopolysaccharide export system permease protein